VQWVGGNQGIFYLRAALPTNPQTYKNTSLHYFYYRLFFLQQVLRAVGLTSAKTSHTLKYSFKCKGLTSAKNLAVHLDILLRARDLTSAKKVSYTFIHIFPVVQRVLPVQKKTSRKYSFECKGLTSAKASRTLGYMVQKILPVQKN
jgi:hypothetical protein